MAGLLGREGALDHRDRMGRRHADRLVEHDPAMHVALLGARREALALGWVGAGSASGASFTGASIMDVSSLAGLAAGSIGRRGLVLRQPERLLQDVAAHLVGIEQRIDALGLGEALIRRETRISGANFRFTRWAISPRI